MTTEFKIKGTSQNILEVKKILLEDCEDYWKTFGRPVMLSKLHKRAARRMKSIPGSILDLLRIMEGENMVHIVMTEKMSRYVYPYVVWQQMSESERFDEVAKICLNSPRISDEEEVKIPTSNYFGNKDDLDI